MFLTKIQALWESRRWWAAVGGVVFVTLTHYGIEIDQETVDKIVMLIAAWIVGDSVRPTLRKPAVYEDSVRKTQ
jgi:hypothetical protein